MTSASNPINPIQRLAFTPGEPAGIGPDIGLLLSQTQQNCQLIFIADPNMLQQRAYQLGLRLQIQIFDATKPVTLSAPGIIHVLPIEASAPSICGQMNSCNSAYVLDTLTQAVHLCQQGICHALVTAPVNKAIINDAGIPFSGHTEFIAQMTGGYPVMMLATPGLRVALATTHLPLSQVPKAIDRSRLERILTTLHHDLGHRFDLKNPKIRVCGLNPHAGENGHLGTEEIETLIPVIQKLQQQGLNLDGPWPADTVFTPKYMESADAILAMYHDQGLPVLKHKGFGHAANITLGLPIIRTSVDHGTALDLAGTGQVSTGSLQYAIDTALQMRPS